MAVRKINESTLTAIGNAIRSKTGGSTLIYPEDMASEIEGIQTGGGEKVLTKLGEHTVTEPVAIISIPTTEQMQSCVMLYIVADLVLSASDWVYPYINNSAVSGASAMGYFDKTDHLQRSFGLAHLDNAKGAASRFGYIGYLNSAFSRGAASLTSINFRNYTSGVMFNSGTVEVWGYV